jgi:hypothetical protein
MSALCPLFLSSTTLFDGFVLGGGGGGGGGGGVGLGVGHMHQTWRVDHLCLHVRQGTLQRASFSVSLSSVCLSVCLSVSHTKCTLLPNAGGLRYVKATEVHIEHHPQRAKGAKFVMNCDGDPRYPTTNRVVVRVIPRAARLHAHRRLRVDVKQSSVLSACQNAVLDLLDGALATCAATSLSLRRAVWGDQSKRYAKGSPKSKFVSGDAKSRIESV